MVNGLHSYKLLFMVQLLVGEGLFLLRLERSRRFSLKASLCAAGLLAAAAAFPIPVENVWYVSFLFLSLFLLTLAALRVCFDEPFGNLLFCAVAGYTVQHLAYLVYTMFNDLTQFSAVFGSFVQPYAAAPTALTDWAWLSVVFYIDAYFVVYFATFELLDPKLKANHNVRLGRTNIVALSSLLIEADVIFNMVTNYYTVGNRASLLLERSYNILVCALILALLNNQLSQRELKDELAGIRYLLEQGKGQYELAKKSVNLINIKYHDLRHQSRCFQDRESREELNRALNEYASLVKTGSEVLDVILTEKTLACRERGIQLMCMADGRGLGFVKTHHLYTLLGNAIDNAVEAVQELPEEQRVISFSLRRQGDLAHIHVENPYLGDIALRDGLPVTTKRDKDYHGFGMLSMKTVAEQYGGGLSIQAEDGVFCLDIVLSEAEREDGLPTTTPSAQSTTKL